MFYGWTSREKALLCLSVGLAIALGGVLVYNVLYGPPVSTGQPVGFDPYPGDALGEEGRLNEKNQPGREVSSDPDHGSDSGEKHLVVDVKGAVEAPGVYSLPADTRVIDAIERAGGLTEEASTLTLNLAQPLTDGTVVYVPTAEEVSLENGSVPVFQGGMAPKDTVKININQATVEQLQQLPGIGPARAEAIVRYREEHGPFSNLEEITNVSGIGPKILENIRDLIEL